MQNRRKKKWADMPEGADSPLNSAVTERDQSTLAMVEEAVRHRQMMLAFQPVMQARPPQGVAFYEGLIRVLDPTGRVIPARDFMPFVEQSETGREIDCAALEMGLQTLRRNPTVRISINMSARSIGYKRWMQILDRHVKQDHSVAERMILEITENSAMTVPELVTDFMDHLQDRGIAFALDDFGAGTTSFRYFRKFFFDALKIDGQFIRGIHADPDNQVLTRALVLIARQFEMFTVATSVETQEDAAFLISIGVDCLQGYLFGAPTVRPPWISELKQQVQA